MTQTWEGQEYNEQPAAHHAEMCDRRKIDNLLSDLRGEFEDLEKKFHLLNICNTKLVAEIERLKAASAPLSLRHRRREDILLGEA